MKHKTTYGLLLLTVIALLIAPQVARFGMITHALPFILYLISAVWFVLIIKNISSPG